MVSKIKRVMRHLYIASSFRKEALTTDESLDVSTAVRAAEASTSCQFRVVIERALNVSEILNQKSSRDRAIEIFSKMRVWDTELNNGILLYLLVAERDVEIVADRGLNSLVKAASWHVVTREMEVTIRTKGIARGIVTGVEQIAELVAAVYPPNSLPTNEIPDDPVFIR